MIENNLKEYIKSINIIADYKDIAKSIDDVYLYIYFNNSISISELIKDFTEHLNEEVDFTLNAGLTLSRPSVYCRLKETKALNLLNFVLSNLEKIDKQEGLYNSFMEDIRNSIRRITNRQEERNDENNKYIKYIFDNFAIQIGRDKIHDLSIPVVYIRFVTLESSKETELNEDAKEYIINKFFKESSIFLPSLNGTFSLDRDVVIKFITFLDSKLKELTSSHGYIKFLTHVDKLTKSTWNQLEFKYSDSGISTNSNIEIKHLSEDEIRLTFNFNRCDYLIRILSEGVRTLLINDFKIDNTFIPINIKLHCNVIEKLSITGKQFYILSILHYSLNSIDHLLKFSYNMYTDNICYLRESVYKAITMIENQKSIDSENEVKECKYLKYIFDNFAVLIGSHDNDTSMQELSFARLESSNETEFNPEIKKYIIDTFFKNSNNSQISESQDVFALDVRVINKFINYLNSKLEEISNGKRSMIVKTTVRLLDGSGGPSLYTSSFTTIDFSTAKESIPNDMDIQIKCLDTNYSYDARAELIFKFNFEQEYFTRIFSQQLQLIITKLYANENLFNFNSMNTKLEEVYIISKESYLISLLYQLLAYVNHLIEINVCSDDKLSATNVTDFKLNTIRDILCKTISEMHFQRNSRVSDKLDEIATEIKDQSVIEDESKLLSFKYEVVILPDNFDDNLVRIFFSKSNENDDVLDKSYIDNLIKQFLTETDIISILDSYEYEYKPGILYVLKSESALKLTNCLLFVLHETEYQEFLKSKEDVFDYYKRLSLDDDLRKARIDILRIYKNE